MKLFLQINSINDYHLLQNDLNRLVAWAETLGLSFNVSKCHSMTFTRIKNPLKFTYFINNKSISFSNSVRDLGFILTPTLSPNMHIDSACCKALKTLGFIKRVASEFKLSTPLKALYCAFVRPILEYGSVIWDPSTATYSCQLERVQRRFLKFVSYILKIDCPAHIYSPVLSHLHLDSLADRRHAANLTFILNLLNGKIDSPTLLSQIPFKVPSRFTRQSVPFHIPLFRSYYDKNQPLRRCMIQANLDPSFSYS
jgi:hypothetical protein